MLRNLMYVHNGECLDKTALYKLWIVCSAKTEIVQSEIWITYQVQQRAIAWGNGCKQLRCCDRRGWPSSGLLRRVRCFLGSTSKPRSDPSTRSWPFEPCDRDSRWYSRILKLNWNFVPSLDCTCFFF